MGYKLICFDLDDTLIREIHSVMLPCILNGKEAEHAVIQAREDAGELTYIEADYLRATLLAGLAEREIDAHFLRVAKPLRGIAETVRALHGHGILCFILTVGPIQVARTAAAIWGFDGCAGSEYEVADGVFTGKILSYSKSEHKVDRLNELFIRHGIAPAECVAVGDGATDLPVFAHCGASIALNASEQVKRGATYAVDTEDLRDILRFII